VSVLSERISSIVGSGSNVGLLDAAMPTDLNDAGAVAGLDALEWHTLPLPSLTLVGTPEMTAHNDSAVVQSWVSALKFMAHEPVAGARLWGPSAGSLKVRITTRQGLRLLQEITDDGDHISATDMGQLPSAFSLSADGSSKHEAARLRALKKLRILDTAPESRYDRITSLASMYFRTESSSLSFVDDHRQWFKSGVNIGALEAPRWSSFCDYTIAGTDGFIVRDASKDPRFSANPWVTGAGHVRFYAGVPIESPDGYRVGALCVIGRSPRDFAASELSFLRSLAVMVHSELWQSRRAA
jgi:GAF domain